MNSPNAWHPQTWHPQTTHPPIDPVDGESQQVLGRVLIGLDFYYFTAQLHQGEPPRWYSADSEQWRIRHEFEWKFIEEQT